jgi:hypothetical protein
VPPPLSFPHSRPLPSPRPCPRPRPRSGTSPTPALRPQRRRHRLGGACSGPARAPRLPRRPSAPVAVTLCRPHLAPHVTAAVRGARRPEGEALHLGDPSGASAEGGGVVHAGHGEGVAQAVGPPRAGEEVERRRHRAPVLQSAAPTMGQVHNGDPRPLASCAHLTRRL